MPVEFTADMGFNADDQHDLRILCERQQGTWLSLGANGQIHPMHWLHRICLQILSFFTKLPEDTALQGRVKQLANRVGRSAVADETLRTFFFERLAPLSRRVWKRDLDESVVQRLKGLREPELSSVQVWAALGNFKSPGDGWSGSYIILDGTADNALGIFKPGAEEPHAVGNPYFAQRLNTQLGASLWMQGSSAKMSGGKGYVSEVATYLVGEAIQQAAEEEAVHNLVPETKVLELPLRRKGNLEGSFQTWCPRARLAHEYLGIGKYYEGVRTPDKSVNRQELELLFILDFLTKQTDRHAANWMVDEEGHIYAIDNGRSFAPEHPSLWAYQEWRNQYVWRALDEAQTPFSTFSQGVIGRLGANREQLLNRIRTLFDEHQVPEAEERIQIMSEQMDVLCRMSHTSPFTLSQVITEDAVRAILNGSANVGRPGGLSHQSGEAPLLEQQAVV